MHFGIELGRSRYTLESYVHLVEEFIAEAGPLSLIPIATLLEVRLCFRAENNAHD